MAFSHPPPRNAFTGQQYLFIHTTYTEYYHRVSDIDGEHNEYEEYNGTFTVNPDGSINTETWTNADGTPFSSYVYR